MNTSAHIPPNLRTLYILEILGNSDRAMTATEINETLKLPKQTVHRLCVTLEKSGFIIRQDNSRKYQIARRLRKLGAGLLHNSRDHILRRQILLNIADSVGETVNYVVPKSSGMSYIDRVETDWAFQIQLPIGSHVPFHCTASGKCFLASLSPKKQKEFVSSLSLRSMTPATHTHTEPLLMELKQIAQQGYSLDKEEFMQGMVAIAVPVTDFQGRFISAIAFHGPTQRLSIPQVIDKKEILIDAANKLRITLFTPEG